MKFLEDGKKITVNGTEFVVKFEKVKFLKPKVVSAGVELKVFRGESVNKSHKQILYKWLVEHARKVIVERVEYYAQKYDFEYKRISIKDTKTRWGSCSSLKNLNFSWRLILLDPSELDYVVVHELSHLFEMNHSKNFWKIVENILPNYKMIRRNLKQYRID